MKKPILSYLPADPHPIEIRYGDLIERSHRSGSTSMWHAALGNLYNNKGIPVIVAVLRSTETIKISAFSRHALKFSRRSDSEHCSVFRLDTEAEPSDTPSTNTATPPQVTSPQETPQSTSDFPPGMMSVGVDIDTQSGSVSIRGRQRDSDKGNDNN